MHTASTTTILKVTSLSSYLVFAIVCFLLPHTFEEIRPITILSALFFILLCLYGSTSQARYWTLLPVVLLTTPNAINELFPSIPMGVSTVYDIPNFSYITHIDIYLLIGIARYSTKNTSARALALPLTIGISYLITTMISQLPHISLMGGFQIRYLILCTILFNSSRPMEHLKQLKTGLIIGILGVIIESLTFTLLNTNQSRLVSGNFGTNTLGHILAAVTAFSFFSINQLRSKIIIIAALTATCIATETRASIFALFLGIGGTILITNKSLHKGIIAIYAIPLLASFLIIFTPQGQSLLFALESVILNTHSFEQAVRTETTSSIITRLIVWQGTISIISDNLFFGVGPGVWSYLKESYNIPFDSLLDPHNDILNLLSSYGTFGASLLIYLIYIKPLIAAKKAIAFNPATKPYIAIILTFVFAGASNAIIWKHQATLLLLTATMILLLASRKHETKNSYIRD